MHLNIELIVCILIIIIDIWSELYWKFFQKRMLIISELSIVLSILENDNCDLNYVKKRRCVR